MPNSHPRRDVRTQTLLIGMALALVLPVLALGGFNLWQYYRTERWQAEQALLEDARRIEVAIDIDLAGLIASMKILAASPFLREGDYQSFHRHAREIRDFIGTNILVRDLGGQQLLNTRVDWGTTLPLERLPGDEEVVAGKQPYVTGLIIGAVAQRPLFTITVPVVQDGEVRLFLNLSITTERLLDMLHKAVSPGRIVAIVDTSGRLLTRTRDPERFVGQPAPEPFVRGATGLEGIWSGADVAGGRVVSAYVRSPMSGWLVCKSMPESAMVAPLRRGVFVFAGIGAVIVVLAIAIAFAIGRHLSSSIGALADRGTALVKGAAAELPRSSIHEVNAVSRALADVARLRLAAEDELRRANATLEQTVAVRTRELVAEFEKREKAEDQLRQAQKMDAIGKLTGGVAHDFNNMLTVILGNLTLMRRRLDQGDTNVQRFAASALDATHRAGQLTQRLLAFARRQSLAPEPSDVNKLVAGMSDLLRRTLGESVAIETAPGASVWPAHVDRNQLESVILNLAVNARDAMPDGGKLTIETANVHLDGDDAALHQLKPGQYICIAVTDTGHGMAADVAAQAFEPFFTTKGLAHGTGLGLSQVYGFMRQSGGHAKIDSEPGVGTTVKLYQPRHAGEADPRGAPQPQALPMGEPGVTILVVEDQEQVRHVTVDAVKELRYRVLEAEGGAAALRVVEAGEQIDLMLTDVVMPDMNGRQLADEALRRRPGLKILFTTGYTQDAIIHNGILDPDALLISKPFTIEQLARKIFEALGPAS